MIFKSKSDKLLMLPINLISPNPEQPRKSFPANEIETLAKSIKENGLLQPITVRRSENGYIIISGERRYRALLELGETEAKCILTDKTDSQSMILSLIENIHREDLNAFETAEAILMLIKTQKLTQSEAAERLSLSQPYLANKLRLLRLTNTEREIILNGGLTERHARAVIMLPEKERIKILTSAAKNSLTVTQTEKLVKKHTEKKPKPRVTYLVRDIRLFTNTINRAIEVMQAAGIQSECEKTEDNKYLTYTIKIEKQTKTRSA